MSAHALPRHVVVTGSTGFIGAQLIRRLKDSGVQVTGLSRAVGFDLLVDSLPLDGVEHVYHGAGLTYVPNAWSDPVSFHLVNGHGTVRVLRPVPPCGCPGHLPERVRVRHPFATADFRGHAGQTEQPVRVSRS